ncbi:hypothetical protein H0A65_04700 [Alcaligenaceae bacterium]|nr:hypothetical protein [Alcaligenaceae bacterium]
MDGGAGRDTLNAHLNGFSGLFDAENPEIKNIEQYNLTVSKDGAHGGVDLARASGYDTLQNIDSRGDLYLGNVNVSEDGKAPTIALTKVRGDTEVTYDDEVDSVSVQNVTASKVGLHDDDANLRIDVDSGRIETLNLNVSNGVYLDLEGDADRIQNLNISGSGILELEGNSDFGYLETLDSTKYTGDLDLDVSGSEVLESVKTGAGDDRVVIHHNAADGDLVVNMGEGENILAIDSGSSPVFGATRLSNLKFAGTDTDGKVESVQTLELVNHVRLANDASLDLTGFDENLSTVLFDEGLDGYAKELAVNSPNADLTLASNDSFEDVDLHTNGITNLTVNVTGGNLDIDQLSSKEPDVDGVAVDAKLETLTLTQTADPLVSSYSALDITSDADHDISNLQTITSTATGSASVEIDASGVDADVNSLTSVKVTSTGSDAEVVLEGADGVVYEAGVQQIQGLSLSTSAGVSIGWPQYRTSGQVTFASDLFPGGILTIPYQTTVNSLFGLSNTAANHTAGAIADIIAELNSVDYGFTASSNAAGEIILTWNDASDEQHPAINLVAALTSATQGSVTAAQNPGANVAGEAEVPMESGTGFEALTDVVVDAQDGDADVELTDVYGSDDGLTVNVTATENAWIDLYNTGVTSVTAAAAHVDIDAAGDTVGNSLLTTISVTSVSADITLADNLVSFDTLDVLNVSDYLVADTSGADFGSLATGDFITYSIGATSDGIDLTTDVDFTGNAAREVYDFAGADIGEVVINGFTWGADPTAGDRLDLSAFANGAGQLAITDQGVGGNVVIEDLSGGVGDFGGSITIIGAGGSGTELAQFNIIFA